MYAAWGPPHLSSVVYYIFHRLIPLLWKTWLYKDCNRICRNPVLDVITTLGTSNHARYYNLLNIHFSSLIDLYTLIIMSSKIDAPYLWIRPWDLVPLNLAYGLLYITMDRLYIPVIILHLSIVAKNVLLQRTHNYGVWNCWQQKLIYCICYTIWIDWHMIFGLEQEGGSLIAPMALAHPLHPIDNRSRNRRRNLWVGWCVSSWWPLFPTGSSVLIYINIYIYIHFLYEFCYRTYIYTYDRSVIQYWWSCASHSIGLYFWGVRNSWVECHFLFSLVYRLCLAHRW